jgi:SNF2 family DNA or RNA helicase
LARSHIVVLDALLKLRQVCCHPRLVNLDSAKNVKQSAKLDMLMDMLPEMIEEGRRILLFSQFTTMLGLIEQELKKAKIGYVKLTGQTRDRETPVRRFQEGKIPLFLISLKAGGVGLNLTAADTVIHFDPWWNPAVERQATDRAHRIGQQKKVFVYKLLCEGTLEEKIQAMQHRKQALADSLYENDGGSEPQWNERDLAELFGPLA